MLKVFIGYDSKESVVYHVLAHSLMRHARYPITIIPLILSQLRNNNLFNRENIGTTEFSLTRFLVPYLSQYKGYSVFMDGDMLSLIDITTLVENCISQYDDKSVFCCKHDYVPKTAVKATGIQTSYPRKNWSSFMIFNNEKCTSLTPEYVNNATPAQLHRLDWINDEEIGELPLEYNWLVGEYEKKSDVKILHYTLGTPCFKEYNESDYADLWFNEYKLLSSPL